ncbi:Beta-galactosidase 9, partial [Cucurbita argyrosperma subsp. sororia]
MAVRSALILQLTSLTLTIVLLAVSGEFFKPFNVSYDHRALIIDGKRRMLISAGVHYPRATPEMWPNIIEKSKEGGADVIQSYVFWNGHEPTKRQVQGFPLWLRDVPGIEFRTDNAPFKEEMERFVKKIVDLLRFEKLFSWQGGPVIMLQVENEYGNIESSFGKRGQKYIKWAAEMALGLGAGVPWVMCQQKDAPTTIINSCNGYYCDGFQPNSPSKPIFWTENWDGWFTSWGERTPHRPVEDLAFSVARFFQRKGSFQNYYMAVSEIIILLHVGLLREPKWGHLKDLHTALKLCEPALVSADSPQYIKLGSKQEAHVYHMNSRTDELERLEHGSLRSCSAFLANIDERNAASVKFNGRTYNLPPWSVSILPDCQNVVFNTAKVTAQTSINLLEFYAPTPFSSNISLKLHSMGQNDLSTSFSSWMTDSSDYLWYFTRIHVSSDDISFWKESNVIPTVTIDSVRDVFRVLVNGKIAGSAIGQWVKIVQPVQFVEGYNDLLLLSETVGLQNSGAFIEKDGAGIRGRIKLTGLKNGDIDLSESLWTYQVGLKGEFLKFYSLEENEKADWTDLSVDAVPSPFTWYKAYFSSPDGTDPVAINLGSMGKGQAWVNGHHIVCYKLRSADTKLVPRSAIMVKGINNLLVLFEETGGNPLEIVVKLYSTGVVCGQVSESNYPPLRKLSADYTSDGEILSSGTNPEMFLHCDDGHVISSIEFASYGTPQGSCKEFSRGRCHSTNSLSVVSQACLGKNSCTVEVSNSAFGGDPCRSIVKTLAVEARCSSTSGTRLSA